MSNESQRVEQQWETPSLEEIVDLTKSHVAAMEMSDHDMVWVQAGMHHVLLSTIGRKSGSLHKVALPTWNDPDGHRIVVASYAGAPAHPSWFLNLQDTNANPRVRCKVQTGEFWSVPEVPGPTERDELWELLCADRAWYRNYQAKTERAIQLVRLAESEPTA